MLLTRSEAQLVDPNVLWKSSRCPPSFLPQAPCKRVSNSASISALVDLSATLESLARLRLTWLAPKRTVAMSKAIQKLKDEGKTGPREAANKCSEEGCNSPNGPSCI